ncbi:MAG: ABC transporter permease [Candidatus Edwardsbacteria bacterium]|nr:ABC transporter permease [Candidatus Edwardsbacteria bacterium]
MHDQLKKIASNLFREAYRFFRFHWEIVKRAVRPPYYGAAIWEQMDRIGVDSLSIVMLVGFFTGFVLAFQVGYAMMRFGAKIYVGGIVAVSLVRELGPVLIAMVFAGRVGAGITAELGAMQVSEQIDAMRALATDPLRKLVLTRVIASVAMLPVLVVVGDLIGILGGMLVGVMNLGLTATFYKSSVVNSLVFNDLFSGLIKPVVFGAMISIVACYYGLTTSGGTKGVGEAVTRTVVVSSVLIFLIDAVITKVLFLIGM